MTITADIEDLAAADFMMVLAQNMKTGQLTIENGDDRLKLAFRSGNIVYAASTGVRETVGAMLVRRGLIDEEQLETALQLQKKKQGGALLGQILVEMEAVTAEDLTGVVYLQFQNVIREALAWTRGVGTFEPMDIPDLGEVRVDPREVILETGIRTEQILLGGAAEHDEAARDNNASPDYFEAVRDVLANLKEESLVVTSEMAATILEDANRARPSCDPVPGLPERPQRRRGPSTPTIAKRRWPWPVDASSVSIAKTRRSRGSSTRGAATAAGSRTVTATVRSRNFSAMKSQKKSS